MLTTVGIFFYQNTLSVREEQRWQSNTREVIVRLDRVFTYSLDSDSAALGMILTSNETYLQPATDTSQVYADDLARLQELLSGDEYELREFDNLKNLLNQKAELNKKLIDRKKQEGFEAVMTDFPLSRMQGLSTEIRSSVDRIKSRELNLLQYREGGLDRNMNRTVMILIVSSLAGVVALVLANLLVMLENKRRRNAELDLIKANEELEANVKERTKELEAVNERLLVSASEREEFLANEHAARREAEIANRLRDEFMATVSHELRTPLNSILGWARLLKNGHLDPRQSSKAIRTIVKNAESQNRLIQDLLDVARMISGKLELDVENVSVSEFVAHSVETIRPEAVKHRISIDLDIDEATREEVIAGDRVRLEQVVGNLLTNAVKFSPEGSIINVDVRSDNGSVEIVVKDRGTGISQEFLPLVFERFRQDAATGKQSGGLGLGLAVVRNLTEMHGGTVSAYSEGENKGSTFTVRLPTANGHGH
ncbi:MAG TPA: ATP-binding protein [Pyrinomonadaceae bacterium]|nr:ATP-binding protein [Pyrinomonadaceae bacterium]